MIYTLMLSIYALLFTGTAWKIGHSLTTHRLPTEVNSETPFSHLQASRLVNGFDFTANSKASSLINEIRLPYSFRGTRTNELTDGESLDSFFYQLYLGEQRMRVLQIGDSHVRGNVLPNTLGQALRDAFGGLQLEGVDADASPQPDSGVIFDYIGINGAHASRFTENDMLERIADFHPDLVIISFGTNEAHGNFDEATHGITLQALVDGIRAQRQDIAIILTTPPGSYIATKSGRRWRDRRGRWHSNTVHAPNHRTERVAANIARFGHEHHLAVWNLFEIAGGDTYAYTNWRNAGLMQTDQIHYTVQGYELQGNLLGQAIIKAYQTYTEKENR